MLGPWWVRGPLLTVVVVQTLSRFYFLDTVLKLGRCRGAVSYIAPVALAIMLIKLSVLM